jgi:hypothetical protein
MSNVRLAEDDPKLRFKNSATDATLSTCVGGTHSEPPDKFIVRMGGGL